MNHVMRTFTPIHWENRIETPFIQSIIDLKIIKIALVIFLAIAATIIIYQIIVNRSPGQNDEEPNDEKPDISPPQSQLPKVDFMLKSNQDKLLKEIDKTGTDHKLYYRLALTLKKGESIQLKNRDSFNRQELLEKSVKLDSTFAPSYYYLGDDLEDNNTNEKEKFCHFQMCIEKNKKGLITKAERAYAYFYLAVHYPEDGVLLNNEQKLQKDLFLESIKSNPEFPDVYYELACTLLVDGEIELLENKIRMNRSELFLKCIHLHRELELEKKAEKEKLSNAYCQLGAHLKETGQSSIKLKNRNEMNVIQLFQKSIELDRSNNLAWQYLGDTLPDGDTITFENVGVKTKEDILLESISLNRDSPNAKTYFDLGKTIAKEITLHDGDTFDKKNLFLKCLSLDENYFPAFPCLAAFLSPEEVLEDLGGLTKRVLYVEYLNWCDKDNADAADVADAFYNLGIILKDDESIGIKDEELTKEGLFKKSIAFNENNTHAYHALGEILPEGGESILFNDVKMTKKDLLART